MLSTKTKKRLTYITFGSYFFMGGIEYAVILPSTWLYIHNTYGAPKYALGLILAAFSLSGLFAGPIMGRWADKSKRVKLIIMFAACWEIVGSFMYFVGISQWFVVASRLVAGVGSGGEAVIIADIARFTTEQERTSVISCLIAIRQTGLLLGPGLNFFLTKANFYIGPFIVNEYTAPGALMTVLWFILNILIFFMFTELEHIVDKYQLEREVSTHYKTLSTDAEPNLYPEIASSTSTRTSTINTTSTQVLLDSSSSTVKADILVHCNPPDIHPNSEQEAKYIKCNGRLSSDENVPKMCTSVEYSSMLIESAEKYLTSDSSEKRRDSSDSDSIHIVEDHYSIEKYEYQSFPRIDKTDLNKEKEGVQYKEYSGIWRCSFFCNEYIREEIVTLLAMQFNSIFAQICMETMVTPLTDKFLHWGEFENSIMYASAGLEVILVFILVGWLSKRIEDRILILFGTVVMAIANSWLIYVLPRVSPDTPQETLWRLAIGIAVDMVSLPFLMVCSVSLYSKLVSKEHQGLGQGIRRSFIGIATILAPLWAGSTIDMPYIMVGVMTAFVGLSLLMLLFSFSKLKVPSRKKSVSKANGRQNIEDDERQPLLA